MNDLYKKAKHKFRQKIKFSDSVTNFLAYRSNIFIIQRPLFAQLFSIVFL